MPTLKHVVDIKNEPEEMSFDAFCRKHSLTGSTDVFMHINASLRSQPTTKTFKRWNDNEIARLQAESAESKRMYREAIARGEIVEPRELTLDEKCEGFYDNPATQAALHVREILKAHGKYQEGM